MKSLIWKDLRENSRWAVLAALVFWLTGVFLAYQQGGIAIWFLTPAVENANAAQVYGTLTSWVLFGAPIIGVALGLLQIGPELRNDQWALLIHRPVSLKQIFLAKAVVGIGLLIFAGGLPLVLITVALCSPGNFPGPFDLRLLPPLLLWWATGIAYYFAAWLVAIRPARWWGSRLLPLVSALVCSCGCWIAVHAWQFIICAAAFIVTLAVAAQGSFTTRGQYHGQSRAHHFALGVTLIVGATAAAICVFACATPLLRTNIARPVGIVYGLTTDGRVVELLNRSGSPAYVADLNGRPMPDVEASRVLQCSFDLADQTRRRFEYYGRYGDYGGFYRMLGLHENVSYFFDTSRKVIDILDRHSRRVIGAIELPGQGLAGPFPEAVYVGDAAASKIFLLLPGGLYVLDEERRALSLLAAPPTGSTFVSAASPQTSDGQSSNYIVAVTNDGLIHCYLVDGRLIFSLPRIQTAAGHNFIGAFELADPQRFVFLAVPIYIAGSPKSAPWHLITVLPTGKLISAGQVPAPVPPGGGKPSNWIYLGLPVGGAVCADAALRIDAAIERMNGRNVVVDPGPVPVVQVLLMLLGGVISGAILLLLARRLAWDRRHAILWAVGVLLLSWPGLLMVLAMMPWPARVRCPRCGRQRVVSRDHCEHCDARFSDPEPDGREIFEAAEPVQWSDGVLTA